MIRPRWSGRSIVVPLITSQSPTFAFMSNPFPSGFNRARIRRVGGKGSRPPTPMAKGPSAPVGDARTVDSVSAVNRRRDWPGPYYAGSR